MILYNRKYLLMINLTSKYVEYNWVFKAILFLTVKYIVEKYKEHVSSCRI